MKKRLVFTTFLALVAAGYIVRTRADENTVEARFGLTARPDAALASGAQFVSTDYPEPDPDFSPGYFVEIEDGANAPLPSRPVTPRLRLLRAWAMSAGQRRRS